MLCTFDHPEISIPSNHLYIGLGVSNNSSTNSDSRTGPVGFPDSSKGPVPAGFQMGSMKSQMGPVNVNVWKRQRVSKAVREFVRVAKGVGKYPRVSKSILEYPKVSEYPRPFKTIQDHSRPFETIWDHSKPFETIQTIRDKSRLFKTIWAHLKQFKIISDRLTTCSLKIWQRGTRFIRTSLNWPNPLNFERT